jgi:hypothetical protein
MGPTTALHSRRGASSARRVAAFLSAVGLVAIPGCSFPGVTVAVDGDRGAGTDGAGQGDWWDGEYRTRQRLTIVETASGSLPVGYSVMLSLDTAGLVLAGTMRADGDDLRIVWLDGARHHELDRRVIGTNTTATQIWFATQAAFDDTSHDYAIYYGNPSAGQAPDAWSDSMGTDTPSRVYLAADDFQEHAAGECPDGWDTCGGQWSVAADGSERRLESTADDTYLLAGDPSWADVVVEARVASDDPQGCPGIASRVQDAQNLVYAGYDCGSSPLPSENVAVWRRTAGGYAALVYGAVTAIGAAEWHAVRVAWTQDVVRLYHDDSLIGMIPASGVAATGRVGLFSTYGTHLYADDMVVRRFVDPEPTVHVGAPETVP